MRPSRSICTPRALPGFGRNSEYGNDEPTISSVSHSFISVQLGFVPSRPMEPVQYGSVSSRTVLPRSAFATAAPSFSATSITSSCAPSAPWPTSIATFVPAFRISAALCRSCGRGTTRGGCQPGEDQFDLESAGLDLPALGRGSHGFQNCSQGARRRLRPGDAGVLHVARHV